MPTTEIVCSLDTETTGVFNFRQPVDHPAQPRVCQVGMILSDGPDHVLGELNFLVKPDGWTIPAEATAVHGITNEACEKYGLPMKQIMPCFLSFVDRATIMNGHSFAFDCNMMQREMLMLNLKLLLHFFTSKPSFCTMLASTDHCKLVGPYGRKWPKLQEAYKHFFNEEFVGAHDAMADVRACRRLYYHLKSIPTPT